MFVDGIEDRLLSTLLSSDCTSKILDIYLSEQENPDDLLKSKDRTRSNNRLNREMVNGS